MKTFGNRMEWGTADVTCDRCHKSCRLAADGNNLSFATLKADWPYGSAKDTLSHEAHFCESCFDWLKEILEKNGVDVRETEL